MNKQSSAPTGFYNLHPDQIMSACEAAGFYPTGEFTQLNSYENRVFDARLENQERVILKFYRPSRWSEQAILEEHQFLQELNKHDVPCVPPMTLANQKTLIELDQLSVAFFPKFYGRMPDELLTSDYKTMGRQLALLHNVGAQSKFKHRPLFGQELENSLAELENWISIEMLNRYQKAAEKIVDYISSQIDPKEFIRIHGDCHRGNLLRDSQDRFFFVDFDDCQMGLEIQDFWMLLASFTQEEKDTLISGYEEFREFPDWQWSLIPALRGARIIQYAAWIARRWSDPSFPRLFPDFLEYNYWAEETEQLEALAWSL